MCTHYHFKCNIFESRYEIIINSAKYFKSTLILIRATCQQDRKTKEFLQSIILENMGTNQANYKIITESLYMNRYLWKLGTEEAVYYRELKQVFLNCVIYPFINKIRQNASRTFPECKVVPVGSFKDGTQVGIPNEF